MPDYLCSVFVIVCLLACACLCYRAGKLTAAGSAAGVCVGWLVYIGGSLTGLALLVVFFSAALVATSLGKAAKQKISDTGSYPVKRDAWQVIANGGTAAMLAALAWFFPAYQLVFQCMMAASLSSAMADTISSELGTVYGRRFYDVLTWRPGQKGADGVVSVEGTLCGIAGSLIIAFVYILGTNTPGIHLVYIVIAGTAGNLADSLLGTALERRQLIGNNMVNFLNTLIAALIAAAWL